MKSYDFYKWRIWTLLAFSFVMALFHRSALGALSSDITTSLNLSASQLSTLASITFYTFALMQIPAGLLLDRFGYKTISLLGMFITGIGSIVFGLSTHLSIAYFSRFLIGLGTSVIFLAVLKAQKIWFTKENFTKASSLLSFIGNMGGVIATFPLALLVLVMPWQGAMVLMGGVCIALSLLIFFFTKSSPEDYNFTPRGSTSSGEKIALSLALRTVLKHPATWRNFFVLFTLVGCTTTLTGLWGISYLKTIYDLTSTEASFYIAFIIYGLIIGSLAINPLAKLFKHNLMLYPRLACFIIATCWGYILFVAKGKPPLIVLIGLFFIIGFFAMSHIIAFTDINTYIHYSCSGLASSVVNSGEFLGSSVISLLIGLSLDAQWHGALVEGTRVYESSTYTTAFSIFFFISLLGIVTTFIGTKNKKA